MDIEYAKKSTWAHFVGKIKTLFVAKADIVDTCTSTATDQPLSAHQGAVLAEAIEDANSALEGHTEETTAHSALFDKKLNVAGGTMTGPLKLSGEPTEAEHAANKAFVESAVETGVATKPDVVIKTWSSSDV